MNRKSLDMPIAMMQGSNPFSVTIPWVVLGRIRTILKKKKKNKRQSIIKETSCNTQYSCQNIKRIYAVICALKINALLSNKVYTFLDLIAIIL